MVFFDSYCDICLRNMMFLFQALLLASQVCNFISFLIGKKLKLSTFSVKMLTMHRWFRFDRANKDLGYDPIIPFREGWDDASEWFKREWLPTYLDPERMSSYGAIHTGSQQKIDGQNKKLR